MTRDETLLSLVREELDKPTPKGEYWTGYDDALRWFIDVLTIEESEEENG